MLLQIKVKRTQRGILVQGSLKGFKLQVFLLPKP